MLNNWDMSFFEKIGTIPGSLSQKSSKLGASSGKGLLPDFLKIIFNFI